jgi:hypothetical protein
VENNLASNKQHIRLIIFLVIVLSWEFMTIFIIFFLLIKIQKKRKVIFMQVDMIIERLCISLWHNWFIIEIDLCKKSCSCLLAKRIYFINKINKHKILE